MFKGKRNCLILKISLFSDNNESGIHYITNVCRIEKDGESSIIGCNFRYIEGVFIQYLAPTSLTLQA